MVDVSVLDILGKHIQTVYHGEFVKSSSFKADVSKLSKGMYLLRIQHKGGTSQVKWIKQ